MLTPWLAAQEAASLHGVVTDRDGSVCEGAQITLATGSGTESRTVLSDDQGRYSFGGLPAGSYKLSISGKGFATQTLTAALAAGESRELPVVVLLVTASTQVTVTADLHEIATAQLNLEEQQRVLGFIPNYYVSYAKDAAPLTPKQKFQLAWRSSIDPMSFVFTGITAGVEQSGNSPASWGRPAQDSPSAMPLRMGTAPSTPSLQALFFLRFSTRIPAIFTKGMARSARVFCMH